MSGAPSSGSDEFIMIVSCGYPEQTYKFYKASRPEGAVACAPCLAVGFSSRLAAADRGGAHARLDHVVERAGDVLASGALDALEARRGIDLEHLGHRALHRQEHHRRALRHDR